MNDRWKEHGICTAEELVTLVQHLQPEKYDDYLAFLSDRFVSGRSSWNSLQQLDWSKLLELRLISDTKEFLADRTMLGREHPFQWRIASEEALKEDEYLVHYQTLDIDRKHMERLGNGNMRLMTTGGGVYELPLSGEENTVKIISYISYDNEGMAHIYDNRLAGFTVRK